MGIENLYKLNTHHDYFHIHKILGIIVFSHFIYRFSQLIGHNNIMFSNLETIKIKQIDSILLCVHGMLSVSSLIYKIPKNPISTVPIIYEDFRTQNIHSTIRTILCILFYIWAAPLDVDIYKLTSVYITIAFINVGSILIFPHTSKLPLSSFIENYMISLALFGGIDISFITLFYLQIVPFFMTLAKKGIIDKNTYNRMYYAIVAGVTVATGKVLLR